VRWRNGIARGSGTGRRTFMIAKVSQRIRAINGELSLFS